MKKNEIDGKKILEIKSWWGFGQPGHGGYILTDEKIIYEYQEYSKIGNMDINSNLNFFVKERVLTDLEYQKVINWINNKIIGKEFKKNNSRDAGNIIFIDYDNYNYVIENNFQLHNEIKKMLQK